MISRSVIVALILREKGGMPHDRRPMLFNSQSDINSLLVNKTESSTPYPDIMNAAPVLQRQSGAAGMNSVP